MTCGRRPRDNRAAARRAAVSGSASPSGRGQRASNPPSDVAVAVLATASRRSIRAWISVQSSSDRYQTATAPKNSTGWKVDE